MALRIKSGGVAVWRPWWGTEGLVLGAACLAFLLVTTMAPKLASEQDWQPLPRDTVLEPLIAPVLRAAAGGSSTAVQPSGADEGAGSEASPLIEGQARAGSSGRGQEDCYVVVASSGGSGEGAETKGSRLDGAGPGSSAAAQAVDCCGGVASQLPSALLVRLLPVGQRLCGVLRRTHSTACMSSVLSYCAAFVRADCRSAVSMAAVQVVVLGILLAALRDPSGLSQLRVRHCPCSREANA